MNAVQYVAGQASGLIAGTMDEAGAPSVFGATETYDARNSLGKHARFVLPGKGTGSSSHSWVIEGTGLVWTRTPHDAGGVKVVGRASVVVG